MTTPNLPNLSDILSLAAAAARTAALTLRSLHSSRAFSPHLRLPHDVKLSADLEAEHIICDLIRSHRPYDGFLAEERGHHSLHADAVWIIDPLDGTVNFSHGHPHFAVSIAWAWQRITYVAVIYDCYRDELYSAIRGHGAFCNEKPIRSATTSALSDAMIATGFGKASPASAASHLLTRLAPHVQKIRISGSAALDLAFVAAGRLDAYLESEISIWDIAAGALLVEEAGGHCLTFYTNTPRQRRCLAAAPHLLPHLLQLLNLNPSDCARTCFDDRDY
ncbi:MAG: inositol monophosphatase [bacterium]|nr:inositol monophosphatase [bacterium]